VNSDTVVAVLSQVPAVPGNSPLETEEAAVTREIVNRMTDSERLLIHGIVAPDRGPEQLDGMQALKEEQRISAWKVYTQFGGWRLDDEAIGIPFIEKARELDVKLICAHKGLSQFGLSPSISSADDIGLVAPMFPDVSFIVYHSGFEVNVPEGPYDPTAEQGVDTLVRAVVDNGIGQQGNVYAELGPSLVELFRARLAAQRETRDVERNERLVREDEFANAKLAIDGDPSLRRPSYRKAGPQSRRDFLSYLKTHEDRPG